MPPTHKVSSGVQQLIDRLRNEGVSAGEREAELLIENARKQAAQILSEAKKEVAGERARAQADIAREKDAAQAAMQLAVRDTVIEMRSDLAARFEAQVRRLVTAELRDKGFLRQLILTIAGRSLPEDAAGSQMEILLAEEWFESGQPDAGGDIGDKIDRLVLDLAAEMLREGIEIKPAGEDRPGIRARLVGADVEVDLTDTAISEALIRHLLPRFRYLVQGIQNPE